MTKIERLSRTADPTLKFAKLSIDGEAYYLAFDFNAIALAEHATGRTLIQGVQGLGDIGLDELAALLHAALQKAHPEMTLQQARRLCGDDTPEGLATAKTIAEAVLMAFGLSLPEKSKRGAGRRRKITHQETWDLCWATAQVHLGLTVDEFWMMTPRQFSILMERHRERNEQQELLFGILAATIVNYSMAQLDKPACPADFMPSALGERKRARRPRIERKQVAADTRAFFAAFKPRE